MLIVRLQYPFSFLVCLGSKKMGFVSALLEIIGFGVGIPFGLIIGYFIFIYKEPQDVKVINILHFSPS